MALRNNTWTDEFYQLASFLYNEPQHIDKRQIAKGNMQIYNQTIANLQKLEYPLNNLFNIMMRLLPQRLKRQILNCFVSAPEADFGQRIKYINNFDELPFIRPDTVLQSEQAHICIELKIEAKLSLKQVYKYLRFLEQWRAMSSTAKIPYLFFLTKGDLQTTWETKERPSIFTEADDLAGLMNYLRKTEISAPGYREAIQVILPDVRLGWATWQAIGESLQEALNLAIQDESNEGYEILENLLGDFLRELEKRRLWHPTH